MYEAEEKTKSEGVKSVKVTNATQSRQLGVVCKDVHELTLKCQQKFHIESDLRFVLNSDGTEIDDEYYETLPNGTVLMVLTEEEEWVGKSDGELKRKESIADSKVMKLVEELRRKKLKTDGKEICREKDKNKMVSVNVGWMNFSFKEDRYKLVKSTKEKPNSGPRLTKLNACVTFGNIQKTLKAMFFPGRKSPVGHEKKYFFNVGTFNGDIIEPTLTVGEYVSGHSKPRIYLLSKQITVLTESSSFDSDFELPKINFNRQRPSATATTSSVEDQINETIEDFDLSVGQSTQTSEPFADSVVISPEQVSSMQSTQSEIYYMTSSQQIEQVPQAQTQQEQMQLQPGNCLSPAVTQTVSFHVNAGTPTVSFNVNVSTCCICMERQREAFIIPCGHTFCMVCAVAQESASSKVCSLCRGNILGVGQIRI